jgi:hypothetical protein
MALKTIPGNPIARSLTRNPTRCEVERKRGLGVLAEEYHLRRSLTQVADEYREPYRASINVNKYG